MDFYYLIKNSLQVSWSMFEKKKKKHSAWPACSSELTSCFDLLFVYIFLYYVLVLFQKHGFIFWCKIEHESSF